MPNPTRTKRFNTPNGPIDIPYTGNREPTWDDVRNHFAQAAARSGKSGQSAKPGRPTPGSSTPTVTLAQLSGQIPSDDPPLIYGGWSNGSDPTSLVTTAMQKSGGGPGSTLPSMRTHRYQPVPTSATQLAQYKSKPKSPSAPQPTSASRTSAPRDKSWNTLSANSPNVEEYDEIPASFNPDGSVKSTMLRAASLGSKAKPASLLENIGQWTGVLPMEDYLGAAWESRVNHDKNAAKILLNQAFPDSTGGAFSASYRDNALPGWVGGAIARGVIGAEMPGPWWWKAGLALGLAVAGNTATKNLQEGMKRLALGDDDVYEYGNHQQDSQAKAHPYATIAGNVATAPFAGSQLASPEEAESIASRFTKAFEPGKLVNPARQWLNRGLDAAMRSQARNDFLKQVGGRILNGGMGATQNSLQNLALLDGQNRWKRVTHGGSWDPSGSELWDEIRQSFEPKEFVGNMIGNTIFSNGHNLLGDAHASQVEYYRKMAEAAEKAETAVQARPYDHASAQEGIFGPPAPDEGTLQNLQSPAQVQTVNRIPLESLPPEGNRVSSAPQNANSGISVARTLPPEHVAQTTGQDEHISYDMDDPVNAIDPDAIARSSAPGAVQAPRPAGNDFASALEAKKPGYMEAAQQIFDAAQARHASEGNIAGPREGNGPAPSRSIKGLVESGQVIRGKDGHIYQAVSNETNGKVRVVRQGHSDRQTLSVNQLVRLISGPSSNPKRLGGGRGGSGLSRSGAQRPWKGAKSQ